MLLAQNLLASQSTFFDHVLISWQLIPVIDLSTLPKKTQNKTLKAVKHNMLVASVSGPVKY